MASEKPIPLQTLSRRGEHSTRASAIVLSRTGSKDGDDTAQVESLAAPGHEGASLPPMDKGFAAWSFVAAGFVLETLVWGFGFTLYHINLMAPIRAMVRMDADETLDVDFPWIVLWEFVARKFRNPRILFGVGGGGLYAPVIIYLSEWFAVRRGLAAAIIFGGSGAGGACFPIAVNFLLSNLGFRWTLRIWAAFMLVFGAIALTFTRPRLPVVRPQSSDGPTLWARIKRQHWEFLKSPLFICMTVTNIIQALAYFPVSLYMTVYTTSLGLSALDGSLVLSVFNFSSIIGQIIFGHACDVAPYHYVIIISGAGAALSAYLLWGFAHSLGLIFAFVVVFGSLSGGFASVWPAASVDIAGSEQSAFLNVYGLLTMTKGIAAIIGPLIAAALYHPEQASIKNTYSGYGFRDVTIFVGTMVMATAAGGVATKWVKRVI
ncbi:unnamed protein product [Rhizoctonia solani]|uniref:Major facilitator superfamily (MFS) profile domain-containing protein n=1 Tax=Rhizoctonia solani TaxID=456999 RepID=A0A8H3BT61_9AGAM|nr:unnamed protein product [Rhizoctonia solani]